MTQETHRGVSVTDEAWPSAVAGDSPATNVLFVHPSYPNQFTAIAQKLNESPDIQCHALVYETMVPQNGNNSNVPHYGFYPDGQVTPQTYPLLNTFETGMRNARGMLNTLSALQAKLRFDAVVGSLPFGSTAGEALRKSGDDFDLLVGDSTQPRGPRRRALA